MKLEDLEPRLLLGPGPSPVAPRVLEALSRPTLGHLDPQFLSVMDEVNEGLRTVFGTRNEMTFPISGTGSAAMEAAMANVLEAGDTAIVGVNGVFGGRLVEMARRMGADVVTLPFGVLEKLYRHPLTDRGLDAFLADWRATGRGFGDED